MGPKSFSPSLLSAKQWGSTVLCGDKGMTSDYDQTNEKINKKREIKNKTSLISQ